MSSKSRVAAPIPTPPVTRNRAKNNELAKRETSPLVKGTFPSRSATTGGQVNSPARVTNAAGNKLSTIVGEKSSPTPGKMATSNTEVTNQIAEFLNMSTPSLESSTIGSPKALINTYPCHDFLPNNNYSISPGNLPISASDLRSMRSKLLSHDKLYNRLMISSKESPENKHLLQELHLSYQTAFNTLLQGYVTVATQLSKQGDCIKIVTKTCSDVVKECKSGVKETIKETFPELLKNDLPKSIENSMNSILEVSMKTAAEKTIPAVFKNAKPQVPLINNSYANVIKTDNRIKITKGPTYFPTKTTSFIIAPTPEANEKFQSFNDTRDALTKNIIPSEVDLKVEKMMRAEGNGVRIEAHSVNLEKLKSKLMTANIGLEVRDDSKFNPRIIVFGVHTSLNKDSIRENFIDLNLNGEDDPEVKVVYVFPPRNNSSTTKVVLEIPSKIRLKLRQQGRVYLGFSSCHFKDHVIVKRCFRCLSFGHISTDCKSVSPNCGRCAGEHETRNCQLKDKAPICYLCKMKNMNEVAHSTFNGEKCPILKKRLTDKADNTDFGNE